MLIFDFILRSEAAFYKWKSSIRNNILIGNWKISVKYCPQTSPFSCASQSHLSVGLSVDLLAVSIISKSTWSISSTFDE